jgi:hypothetical protein
MARKGTHLSEETKRKIAASHKGKGMVSDHVLSNVENQRRHLDKVASINDALNEARRNINWQRRNEAERDVVKWVNVYCVGVLLDDPPPPKGEEILREMARAIIDSRPYMIL